MNGRKPIRVESVNGAVVITCLPIDARDIAAALGEKFVLEESTRPSWVDDLVALQRVAAAADLQAGNLPAPVMVELVTYPRFKVLPGGEPA